MADTGNTTPNGWSAAGPLPRGHRRINDRTFIRYSFSRLFHRRFHPTSILNSALMAPAKRTKATSKGKGKPKVYFTAQDETGKRKGSPSASAGPASSRKKQRTTSAQDTTGTSSAGGAASSEATTETPTAASGLNGNDDGDEEPLKRVRNPWGIRSKEVPKDAKPTQVRLLLSGVNTRSKSYCRRHSSA